MTTGAPADSRFWVPSRVEASPTSALDRRVKAKLADGIDVARLNGGYVDHPAPAAAIAAAGSAVGNPALAEYTANAGLPELRREIAAWYADRGVALRPDEVIVTNGAKHAISLALNLVLDPGSEVVLPTPHWPTFPAAVTLARGVPVPAPSTEGPAAPLSRAQLEAVVSERTKALILVTPDNPSGRCTSAAEVAAICDWAHERGLWVIVDETYAGLTYERAESTDSPLSAGRDNLLRIGAVSKTFCIPGWRVGWLAGPAHVVVAGSAVHSHTVSHVSNLAQMGALGALQDRYAFLPELREVLRGRRDRLCVRLEAIDGVHLQRPAGGIYAYMDIREALPRLGCENSRELAERILETHRVAVLPGEAFGAPGWLRLSFGGKEDANDLAADRLAAALSGRG